MIPERAIAHVLRPLSDPLPAALEQRSLEDPLALEESPQGRNVGHVASLRFEPVAVWSRELSRVVVSHVQSQTVDVCLSIPSLLFATNHYAKSTYTQLMKMA